MFILACIFFVLPIIEKIEENYRGFETIQGEVLRYTMQGENKDFMKGEFCIKRPNKLYINYVKPPRTIVLSDSLLWIYLPDEKTAIKIDYRKLSQMEKSLLGLDSFLGINPIEGFEDKFDFELENNKIVAIPPQGTFISKLVIEVDTTKMVVQELDIFDVKGKLYSKTVYGDFKDHANVWFPHHIITEIFPARIKEETVFKGISINEDVDSLYFNFIPYEGIKVIERR
ncbi:MAG: outer membrane lipoprotein carrier protein LolA [bacterium]|nr:outer membrane lipoprotein carrier protein LolA [bacterium]